MPTKWYDSKVIRIKDETPTTKRFWLKIEDEEIFDFKAGQFVTMDLPIGDKRRDRWRSYSIANPPDRTNVLEFCIVHLDGGTATEYLFNELELGGTVRFKGPDGGFVLPENIKNDLVFVCTGTGVAPFRSMILDLQNQGKPHQNIHLIFGTRRHDGILYQQEFEQLLEKMPGFRYSVALSREDKVEKNGYLFDISKGYVHPVYMADYKNLRPDIEFYLCGWTQMVDEAVANLIVKMGYDRTQVKYELYG
ncbi:MAG: FAD-dependent oxidoreductase [Lewinellaceae bacterium]|nr:FAD-dependent oxidoreductase [Saprospiraceae bacterium]MCB9337114.1 FAD-dependent oxidoreductase [Lewinellaceae bacterium]